MKMRKGAHKESMAPVLDDLLNDGRLARLFSNDDRHCALQLWILQIKVGNSIENRVVYGRLLPYNYSNSRWSSSDDDNFRPFAHVQAQVIRLNLYVKSVCCADLLRQLSAGKTISVISETLKLGFSGKAEARVGATALAVDNLVFRPVAYLLNRDAHARHSLSSPHGGAGAFSASITQTGKEALFRLSQDYNVALTESVVKHLNGDTGLDFGCADTTRFGDIELLVFPALDDLEQPLLKVDCTDAPRALIARFNPTQVPHFNGFQFRLSIANDGQIVYSAIATAKRDAEDVFVCKFELSDQLRARTDCTELEIFGFHGDLSCEGTLCFRWRMGYIREIHVQGHVAGHGVSMSKFDWLEKSTRPSAAPRVKEALEIKRGNQGFANRIGGREADPWVPANRDLRSLFARLHPPKSEGQFFMRWGLGDGEGRLQFVEWFKTQLTKYPQHQVVIFDPYFEDAGLGLLLLCVSSEAEYIAFRSLPKKPSEEDGATPAVSDKPPPSSGIDNLVANCERNRHLLKNIKLRVYGLKEGTLHDRYILIVGPDRLPVVGFNLSNSLQSVAQNYPLLITPIPADVLLKVEQYKSELLRAAQVEQPQDETVNSTIRLLFDSTTSPMAPRHYEPLRFLDSAEAGDVLSVWTGEPTLKGLRGDSLKERMTAMGLLKNDSLELPNPPALRNCLAQQAGNFSGFTANWIVLGEVLAHSSAGDNRFRELESERGFLEFLARYLEESFSRAHAEVDKELVLLDTQFFRKPVEVLLNSSYYPHHLNHAMKYSALTWAEYYTITFLWWYSPEALLLIAEKEIDRLPLEPEQPDAKRISLLSQIVSKISLSVQFDINEAQRDRLIRSSKGLFQWMGLNAIEMQLQKPGGLATVLQLLSTFIDPVRVRFLGWMVHHTAGNEKKADTYKGLIEALHKALPEFITAEELRCLVDSMRGHMRKLSWTEPWLFRDVVFPLLKNDRAKTDDACAIWIQELADMLEPLQKDQPRLFDRAREGQTTNISAFLFANSSPERQQSSLKSVQAILKRQERIVNQPLASTSNWTRWNGALEVSMWILTFTRWGQYYLRERKTIDPKLEELSQRAHKLAMVRPMDDWRQDGAGQRGEFAAFLEQVVELLATRDEKSVIDSA